MERESAYLFELVERAQATLADDLVGVYAGGSWALGGYEPGRSDLDVAVVVRSPLSDEKARELVLGLRHEAFPCPARGLELVVYTLDSAGSPSVEPEFELNLNTGAGMPFRAERGATPGEGHWFAVDRSVLAAHGVPLYGPPADEVFTAVPAEDLRPVLAELLRWYEREDPEGEDAVLNAGRSLRFVQDGAWAGKPAMRAWAASQEGTNADILRQAIDRLEAAAK